MQSHKIKPECCDLLTENSIAGSHSPSRKYATHKREREWVRDDVMETALPPPTPILLPFRRCQFCIISSDGLWAAQHAAYCLLCNGGSCVIISRPHHSYDNEVLFYQLYCLVLKRNDRRLCAMICDESFILQKIA